MAVLHPDLAADSAMNQRFHHLVAVGKDTARLERVGRKFGRAFLKQEQGRLVACRLVAAQRPAKMLERLHDLGLRGRDRIFQTGNLSSVTAPLGYTIDLAIVQQ